MQFLRKIKVGTDRYRLWLRQGEFDLEAATLSFKNQFYEWCAYQSEQGVEKALKAVIIHAGYVPPKVHKLSVLMGFCNSLNVRFSQTKFNFRDLDSFTFISRYPFLLPDGKRAPHELIQPADAERVLNQAKDFIAKIKLILEDESYTPSGIPESAYQVDFKKIDMKKRMESVVSKLVPLFNPEKIIMFGSYAREEKINEMTTIDLLIIAKTDLDFISRIKAAREATRGAQPSIEPLIYTPDEYKAMREVEGEGFLESAIDEGIIVYEKQN